MNGRHSWGRGGLAAVSALLAGLAMSADVFSTARPFPVRGPRDKTPDPAREAAAQTKRDRKVARNLQLAERGAFGPHCYAKGAQQ